ncbi:hypothetical protein SEA_HARAMBE_28 [Gordonia phage Harambe]|uniref:Uncharacterized protein n=6 Tax=Woesvirus woes TaxID=1982751 RepID=A0A2H4PFX4_9CAUD|nr:hypothetical protein SEA_ANAMIKA_28 [Gordonia phage Anamika]AVP43213.1 hypothetical protein PBI_HAIL2PITT_28 [Gordonia phage Hail2Pitt]QAX94635.1 hypothetical protein SEA_HARAMBE_28 [Gordonia phage Harambe]QAX95389.1 hypothetical protein SEA_NEOEVIE_28 [Gordonia phage Neoevie]QBP30306.1 hypothetical protein SEA_JORMUNGANDR_28 [Gordonia phage Jormungandr]QBP30601.1 hypothetical protein SEA_LAHIRIUM_28 [Gordonia phage Lahirium]
MAAPIESGSRTTSGSYTLPVPAWANVIDFFLLGGGNDGSDGTTYGSGSRGADGEYVTGSFRVRPGSSLPCSIAAAGGNTTINFGGVVSSSGTGPTKPSSNTLTNSSLMEGDPAVASSWSVNVGSRGDGGAGGSSGGGSGAPGTGGGLYWRFRIAAQTPRVGTKLVEDIRIGSKQVQAIYIGTKKVWEKPVN